MGRYSREEIETAFEHYQDMGLAAARSGDWSQWGKMFTADCSYQEHCLGEWGGREAVVREMSSVMHVSTSSDQIEALEGPAAGFARTAANPWIWCNQYPVNDYVIDVDRGWVWSLVWNRMEDPGDGRVFQCNVLTVLYYAGNGLFSHEEDLYNPRQFAQMMDGWLGARAECEARGEEPADVRDARAAAARSIAIEPDAPPPELSQMRPAHTDVGEIAQPHGRFATEEILQAFERYQQGLARAGRTNDWRHWGACLTPDTTLIDCELGHLGKRDAVVREVEERLHRADDDRPWAYLNHFPIGEYVIDEQRDTIWTFIWARFRDPGNGSRHEAKIFLRMVYAGDGLFKEIETLYDPNALKRAMASWRETRASFDERRETRAKELAARERAALEMAPLKLDESGNEIR